MNILLLKDLTRNDTADSIKNTYFDETNKY